MSIARALLLAARRHCSADLPKLGPQQVFAAALQNQQQASSSQQVPTCWRQARGFAAPGSDGGRDGKRRRDTEEHQPQGQPSQQARAADQAGAETSEEAGAPSASQLNSQQLPSSRADSGGSGASDSGATGSDSEQGPGRRPNFSQQHADFQKHIQKLKELKGSSTVLHQDLGGLPTLWEVLLQATLGNWLQGWISEFIRTRVEREFDVGEALEGAKDAFWIVHKLLEEEDWDNLKTMVSAKMLTAFKDTVDAYKADGLVWRTAIAGDLQAGIRGLGFATKQQMAEYDEEQAALAPEDTSLLVRPAGTWLVLTVQICGDQRVTISKQENGQVVADLRDRRPARWRFATGPLPGKLPVNRLDTQWFLLSI